MKLVQRIMVGTEILWQRDHASDRLLEHPTQRLAIDSVGVYAKSDNAPALMIHHY